MRRVILRKSGRGQFGPARRFEMLFESRPMLKSENAFQKVPRLGSISIVIIFFEFLS